MNKFRIVEKENCYGGSMFYVQQKGLLWGWNYVRDIHDMVITFQTEEFALRSIREWNACRYYKIVNITEMSSDE